MSTSNFCVLFILVLKFLPSILSSEALDKNFKLMCYITDVSQAGPSSTEIYTTRCSHIIYAYAELSCSASEIQFIDRWTGFDEKYGKHIADYHKIRVKVGISLGRWDESTSERFSHLVRDSGHRSHFVNQTIAFLKAHNFDGLEVAWSYPVCWQKDCTQGQPDEKDNFAKLMQELSQAFKPAGLFLSCYVDSRQDVINKSYDVAVLSRYVDWLVLFGEERQFSPRTETSYLFPLYPKEGNHSMAYTVDDLINRGVDPLKIVVKIITASLWFTLQDASKTGVGARITGPTKEFNDVKVCKLGPHTLWTLYEDEWAGSYAVANINMWLAYNNKQLNCNIAHFVRERGLLGAMMADPFVSDDPHNKCGGGKYPTLEAVYSILKHPRADIRAPK